jgi:hypothetical protein
MCVLLIGMNRPQKGEEIFGMNRSNNRPQKL